MTGPAANEPAVTLIVVNFNGVDSLKRCVDSLVTGDATEMQIIIVDNASTDDSPAVLRELSNRHSSLEILWSEANRGYSAAVNLALPLCRGRYLAILNMDVVATRGWLTPLVAFLDAHPQVACASPLIALMDGRTVNALGQDLHLTGLGFNGRLGQARHLAGVNPRRTAGLHGAAFLIRRSILTALGGMDESGFLYHADVNLSWMLRLHGHDIACVPASIVHHDYFLSMHPNKLFLLEKNRWELLLTVLGWRTLVIMSPALLLTEAMVWAYASIRGRAFIAAKGRTYSALWRTRAKRRRRRNSVLASRTVGDWSLLRQMQWHYPWSQFTSLALERGTPRRPF